MKTRIIKICGDSPLIPNFEEISNSPNYVFTPDPNFTKVTLFDVAGNVVNLNSWIECAFYVNGGWTNNVSDFVNGEKTVFLFLVFGSIGYIIFDKFLSKIFKNIDLRKYFEINE